MKKEYSIMIGMGIIIIVLALYVVYTKALDIGYGNGYNYCISLIQQVQNGGT